MTKYMFEPVYQLKYTDCNKVGPMSRISNVTEFLFELSWVRIIISVWGIWFLMVTEQLLKTEMMQKESSR
jgi:hypothetical protein